MDSNLSGATGDGTSTVTVPFSSVIVEVVIETLGGDDTVKIDLGLGDFPLSVFIDGGDSNRGDELELLGGSFDTQDIEAIGGGFGDVTAGGNFVSWGLTETVTSSIDALDATISYSNAAETLSITPFGLQQEQILIGSSFARSLALKPPSRKLTINGGDVGDNPVQMIGSYDLQTGSIEIVGDEVVLDGVNLFTNLDGAIRIEAERNLLLDDNTLINDLRW